MDELTQLIDYLKKRKMTIATAESCTGGLIAKLITDVPGSSHVFMGGVVSYHNDMKVKILGVKLDTLNKYGAVSETTVVEMLTGIIQIAESDLGIAVSGIAGPAGGSTEKPVGTVYIGVAFGERKWIKKYLFKGSRDDIRMQGAKKAIQMIQSIITEI